MSSPRHRAREAALQSLYLWEVGGTDPASALETFFGVHQPDAPETVRGFARELVLGTAADLASLDKLIQEHSEHWRLERLAVIDRLILRMATWELQHETDTPPAVVLNEALELARTFSTDDSVRFVNGVLDSIRKALASNDGAPGL
jgi:transcription antitermination protein NusB